MAKFEDGQIRLSQEDKELLREAGSVVGQNSITNMPNLREAIKDGFIGWEIKQKEPEDDKFDKIIHLLVDLNAKLDYMNGKPQDEIPF